MDTIPAGAAAPPFSSWDENGQVHSLAGYRGSALVLCFLREAGRRPRRDLAECYPAYREPGVFVLGVLRGDARAAGRCVRERGVPFPVLCDPRGTIAAAYGVADAPGAAYVVIGRDGRVRATLKRLANPQHVAEVLRRAALGSQAGRRPGSRRYAGRPPRPSWLSAARPAPPSFLSGRR